ncbi:uncharacterized protein BP01DRAFT_333382, partial [Aspergillus saccharolyticus JOP 1030-1]
MALSGGLTFTTTEPLIRWNSEKRKFLCCLFRFFKRNLSAYKAVFDAVYQDDLRSFGFNRDGVSKNRLSGQWHHLKRTVHPDWVDVHMCPFDKDGRWAPFIATIRRTLRSSNIRLEETRVDCIDTSVHDSALLTSHRTSPVTPNSLFTIGANVRPKCQSEVQDDMNLADEAEEEDMSLCHYGGKVCFWCVQERVEEVSLALEAYRCSGKANCHCIKITVQRNAPRRRDDLPPVLYRWSNVDSQGVNKPNFCIAGLFEEWDSYFSPDTISEEKFNEYFLKHIHREKVASPFISTFQSMLSPVHRAIRNKEGALISIFNNKKLDFVYSAKSFCREHRVRVERSDYKGVGEYLIWGKVPRTAIICSFKISALEKTAAEHDDVANLLQLNAIASYECNRRPLKRALSTRAKCSDHEFGNSVGKLLSLLDVKVEYSREVGERMFYAWQLRERGGPTQAFYEGISAAYGGPVTLIDINMP